MVSIACLQFSTCDCCCFTWPLYPCQFYLASVAHWPGLLFTSFRWWLGCRFILVGWTLSGTATRQTENQDSWSEEKCEVKFFHLFLLDTYVTCAFLYDFAHPPPPPSHFTMIDFCIMMDFLFFLGFRNCLFWPVARKIHTVHLVVKSKPMDFSRSTLVYFWLLLDIILRPLCGANVLIFSMVSRTKTKPAAPTRGRPRKTKSVGKRKAKVRRHWFLCFQALLNCECNMFPCM